MSGLSKSERMPFTYTSHSCHATCVADRSLVAIVTLGAILCTVLSEGPKAFLADCVCMGCTCDHMCEEAPARDAATDQGTESTNRSSLPSCAESARSTCGDVRLELSEMSSMSNVASP